VAEQPVAAGQSTAAEQPSIEGAALESFAANSKDLSGASASVTAAQTAEVRHQIQAALSPQPVAASPFDSIKPELEARGTQDVKCFKVELSDGGTYVVVQRADGKRWRFERNSIDFELACDAEALQTWLSGISDQQMPGLLTLLAEEVNCRGAKLKAAEKQRDALRGTEDYDFFGLDGSCCSDKDVERAYRKMSTTLHPDKGGDEQSFNAMRERYEQIKHLRGETKRQGGGGGAICWDPSCRGSMLTAHSDLREQLIWITKLMGDVGKDIEERQRRHQMRALVWDCPEAEPPGPSSA